MERLPTEILDHIISYVEDHEELAALRLVDKGLCRTASRLLFRCVGLRLGYRQFITNFEVLSLSEYASHVRGIVFNPRPFYEDRQRHQYVLLANELVERLPSLLVRFPQLNTITIWPLEWTPEPPIEPWFSKLFKSIANLRLDSVTRLVLPTDACDYLVDCLEGDNETSVTQFIRQIQHLGLESVPDHSPYLAGLDILLRRLTNLVSLEVWAFCEAFDRQVENLGFSQPLRLESLNLGRVYISSYEVLGLLEQCKDTIKYFSIDYVALDAGTWLHLLMQIKKNLKLFNFFLFRWKISLEQKMDYGDMWLSYGFFRRDYQLICLALGDIQRQVNANRLAAGLELWSKKEFQALDLPPLQSVMDKARYRELSSQSWDAEKNDSCYCDFE